MRGVHRLGHLGLGGDADGLDGEAVVGGQLLIDPDGVDGVGLAGGVDDADGVRLRLDGPDELQLPLDGGARQEVPVMLPESSLAPTGSVMAVKTTGMSLSSAAA